MCRGVDRKVVNLNIKPGVTSDEGGDGDWPEMRSGKESSTATHRAWHTDMARSAVERREAGTRADGWLPKRS